MPVPPETQHLIPVSQNFRNSNAKTTIKAEMLDEKKLNRFPNGWTHGKFKPGGYSKV